MSTYGKKNPNFYCEYCNVWMADHPAVRANHDQGAKHKANVDKKLRDMQTRSDREEKDRAATERAMQTIEAAAQRQYQEDRAAEEAHKEAVLGKWEYHVDSGYYYNAVHRWYYDLKSKMYYGGDPAEWSNNPNIPIEARYDAPPPAPSARTAGGGARPAARTAAPVVTAIGGSRVSTARVPQTVRPGQRVAAVHPAAGVGGYQMPEIGRIGGAKGMGASIGGKRGREEKGDGGKRVKGSSGAVPAKPVSKEEAEFLARREAARQRVEKRSMQTFGLG